MAALSNQPETSFLTQRFAKLDFGLYTVIGYSVAGEESVVQVPELNVAFDVGRGPQFMLTSDLLCLTHGHMDHVAGLAYYLSQRYFQGMKAGTILLPAELEGPIDGMLKAFQRIERQTTPYELVPMRPGEMHKVRRDFGIRALGTHHGGPCLGFACVSVREKLKPEYQDYDGPALAKMKQEGVEIQYTLEVPTVTYLGDTGPGPVFENDDVTQAQLLITECTFFEKDHLRTSKHGKHLHVQHFADLYPKLSNEHIVLQHVSRRTGVGKAKRILTKTLQSKLGDDVAAEALKRIHFLMDLKGAAHAGDAAEVALGTPGK